MTDRLFLRDTQTEPTTANGTFDLATDQGSPADTLLCRSNDTAFAEHCAWVMGVGDRPEGTSFPYSLRVDSVDGDLEFRWRVQRRDSTGTVLASSPYSGVEATAGTYTGSLALDESWGTGDILALSLEVQRAGGHGNVDVFVSVQHGDSFVDADLAVEIPVLDGVASGSGEGRGGAVGAVTLAVAATSGSGQGSGQAAGGNEWPIDEHGSFGFARFGAASWGGQLLDDEEAEVVGVAHGSGIGSGQASGVAGVIASASGSGTGSGSAAATQLVAGFAWGSGVGSGQASGSALVAAASSGSGAGVGAAAGLVLALAAAAGSGVGDGTASGIESLVRASASGSGVGAGSAAGGVLGVAVGIAAGSGVGTGSGTGSVAVAVAVASGSGSGSGQAAGVAAGFALGAASGSGVGRGFARAVAVAIDATPLDRIVVVLAEQRIAWVSREDRTARIEADGRFSQPARDPRDAYVGARRTASTIRDENRKVTVRP